MLLFLLIPCNRLPLLFEKMKTFSWTTMLGSYLSIVSHILHPLVTQACDHLLRLKAFLTLDALSLPRLCMAESFSFFQVRLNGRQRWAVARDGGQRPCADRQARTQENSPVLSPSPSLLLPPSPLPPPSLSTYMYICSMYHHVSYSIR